MRDDHCTYSGGLLGNFVIAPTAWVVRGKSAATRGLGEVHKVAENPLVICALLKTFGLGGLALECRAPGGLAGWFDTSWPGA
jgi:hypothetical protein